MLLKFKKLRRKLIDKIYVSLLKSELLYDVFDENESKVIVVHNPILGILVKYTNVNESPLYYIRKTIKFYIDGKAESKEPGSTFIDAYERFNHIS